MIRWYVVLIFVFFFFKQKTAYEMRISDWSSDVCSSDLKDSLAAQSGQAVLQIIAVEPDGKILGRIMLGGDTEGRHDIAGGKDAADQIGRASCRERVCQYV